MEEPKYKRKYFALLDMFITIKKILTEDMAVFFNEFNAKSVKDGFSYKESVVKATICDYEYLAFSKKTRNYNRDNIVESLYRMSVSVNPSLDINRIVIPVRGKKKQRPLVILEKDNSKKSMVDVSDKIQDKLKERVIGQDEAIRKITFYIQSAKIGLKDPDRPVGCFLFVGQTGVGKTELAKALAEAMMGDEKNMVRVDCSEFSQPHEYAKLIGSPPGYIGYDDGGFLTEPLLATPENIILFDEIEKAHPKVHNLLLQIMDDGILTDNKGNEVSFKDAIIILTSNIGVEGLEKIKKEAGFTKRNISNHNLAEQETIKSLKKFFRPEFLNRLDEIIYFKPLGKRAIKKIVNDILLERLRKKWAKKGINFVFNGTVPNFIAQKCFNSEYGARPAKRAVKRYIEKPLTKAVLKKSFIFRGGKNTVEILPNGRIKIYVAKGRTKPS